MDRSKLVIVMLFVAAACGGQIVDAPDDRASPPAADDHVATPTKRPPQTSSTNVVETRKECPDTLPSEQDWCPWPQAICPYPDTCSQRPSTASAIRSYECTGSRWTWVSSHYDVTCPPDVPENGSPCEPMCKLEAPCDYTTECGKASAVCDAESATWHVSGNVCTGDGGTD